MADAPDFHGYFELENSAAYFATRIRSEDQQEREIAKAIVKKHPDLWKILIGAHALQPFVDTLREIDPESPELKPAQVRLWDHINNNIVFMIE